MISIRSFDVIYLSYDEPFAEAYFADLQGKCPKAKHVCGVKGLDAGYRATAEAAGSDFFITIDGDSIVDPAFFELHVDPRMLGSKTVMTWPGRSAVHGLTYGNGAIKLWPRVLVREMQPRQVTSAVDLRYNVTMRSHDLPFHLDRLVPFSTSHHNGTPRHAFRAAFREGVRLTLRDGRSVLRAEGVVGMDAENRKRLLTWCTIGRDVPNGAFSLFAARLGAWLAASDQLDIRSINDYDWFENYWTKQIEARLTSVDRETSAKSPPYSSDLLEKMICDLGEQLRAAFGLRIVELDGPASQAFKSQRHALQPDPIDRHGLMWREGWGVQQDGQEAGDLFEVGALAGVSNAMVNLARALRTGELGKTDYLRSVELLKEARVLGNLFAEDRIIELQHAGFGWGIGRESRTASPSD